MLPPGRATVGHPQLAVSISVERDIRDSVGDSKQGASNRESDVRVVQGLLNIQIVKDHRSDRLGPVDGSMGRETLAAIKEFQRRHGLSQIVLIKRGDATMRALASFSGPPGMHVSTNPIEWLESPKVENFSALPYNDAHRPIPNATIGFGHVLHRGPVTNADRAKWGPNGISRARATELLRADLSIVEGNVHTDVKVPLTQNQFDALVSFAFNAGSQSFKDSTLLRLLNRGDYLSAANEFHQWKRSGTGHPSGLGDRRESEKARFEHR